MTKELLNRTDIVTVLEQVSREGVTEGVAARGLEKSGPRDGVFDRALDR